MSDSVVRGCPNSWSPKAWEGWDEGARSQQEGKEPPLQLWGSEKHFMKGVWPEPIEIWVWDRGERRSKRVKFGMLVEGWKGWVTELTLMVAHVLSIPNALLSLILNLCVLPKKKKNPLLYIPATTTLKRLCLVTPNLLQPSRCYSWLKLLYLGFISQSAARLTFLKYHF